ncbi:MAG: metal-dependent phosphohydrolase [Treponema sp.]|nr:metal-dependent phosphohydrolase [Treponema sp.]
MDENKKIIPLRNTIFSQDIVSSLNREYLAIMIRENTKVICINKNAGKKRNMPFKALYENNNRFWLQDSAWEYFIEADEFAGIKEKAASGHYIPESKMEAEEEPEVLSDESELGFGKEADVILSMTIPEQVNKIEENKSKLNDLIVNKTKDPAIVTEALVETTKDAALINHAVLMNAMKAGDDEAKKITQTIVTSTTEMVKASVQLVTDDIFDNELMAALVQKSNGTIVQHMTRVYLCGISFLAFYNKLVSTSSIINKLRISFNGRYRNYYHTLIPNVDMEDLSLEHVFYKGMRSIPAEIFTQWAVGFLIHDIGKAGAVEYHEGEAAYNRDIVVEHVKLGYTSVMNKTSYPREAGLITGYHHEYYGDSSGYGYFRTYLEQYKKANPKARQDYCITYELEPMLDFIALAYFPAKVLEIIDVYDSVTDPNRKYHKAMKPEEALSMMREEFIVKKQKIDPVLFDIFETFIKGKLKT